MKAIMYHYVRPETPDLPFLRALHIEDFGHQLDHFAATARFVERAEFLEVLEGAPVPRGGVVLTFDDGLLDHYDYVLPVLEARGLWGLFYIPTGVHTNGRPLDVHRVHCLLGRHGGVAMMAALSRLVEPRMLVHDHIEEFHRLTYARQDNDEATTRFKRSLNYFVAHEWRTALLDRLMADHFPEEGLVDRLYASVTKLAEMRERGMLIGSHSVSHGVFATLEPERQAREIGESFEFLEKALGGPGLRHFCYPYGGFHTFTAETERLLDEAGCRFSFNVEPRDVTEEDLRRRPQALPRYDCNEFPFGQCRPMTRALAQGAS